MSAYIEFPDSEESLVRVVDDAVSRGNLIRNINYITWYIAHWYLQGVRKFDVASWELADITLARENVRGQLEFKYEGLLYQYRVELSRLLKLDVSPSVKRAGFGLQSVRKAGTANGILQYMTERSGVGRGKRLFRRFLQGMIKYGMVGLTHYRMRGEDIGERTGVEVVPPWELLSIPGEVQTQEDVRGIMRRRRVPLSWVKGLGLPSLGRDEQKWEVQEVPYGQSTTGEGPGDFDALSFAGGYESGQAKIREAKGVQVSKSREQDRKKEYQKIVWFDEVWLYGPRDQVSRYIVKVGKKIADDQKYSGGKGEDKQVVCPMQLAWYVDTGHFYGRGFVDSQLGLNWEIEKMLGNVFQNVTDLDQFPFLVLPATSGVTRTQVTKPERRKVLVAESDPVNPQAKPYAVEPATNGDFPLKVAEAAVSLQDKWSGQGPLYSGEAPGRTDSASALGFAFETGNTNIGATIHSIADCYSGIYESMLQAGRAELLESGQTGIQIPFLDDRMLGVGMNVDTGEMSLDKSPIPEPWEVQVDISERALTSKEQKKQEAWGMLQNQVIGLREFKILNEKEGLGFPVVSRTDFEAWQKATFMKIVMFNDGVTPGEVEGNIHTDDPMVMLGVLQELMSGVAFSLASVAVQDAFIELKTKYENMIPQMPAQLPGIEEMGALKGGGAGPENPVGAGIPGGMPQG